MEKRARHTSTANGGGPAPMATTTTTAGGGGDATKPPNWGGVPDGMPTSSPPAPSAPGAATSPPPAPRSEEAIAMVKASHVKGETVAVPGLHLTDHSFRVPLDHARPSGPAIDLFARTAVSPARAASPELPFLLFLTGGPGFEAPRPTGATSWLKAAAAHFRIVLLDQRGTGRSGAVLDAGGLAGAVGSGDPGAQAAYLAHFRADAIVRDAEAVRVALVPPGGPQRGRWSVLGQSYGGFAALSYLCLAPEGLTEVMLAGGLPPDVGGAPCPADAAYAALFARVAAQNAKYYARFPGDAARAREVVLALALGLPSLGLGGGFERLHWLLERAFDGGGAGGGRLTAAFLRGVEAALPWDANPLYALLHEPIYANGGGVATAWSAARVRAADPARDAAFDAVAAARAGRDVLFTGEMVFPWLFEGEGGCPALAALGPVAHALAAKADWPALYDVGALARNAVPVAAAVYWEDMYVDFELSQATGRCVRSLRQWVTNEVGHSGIRDEGGRVFDQLLGLVRGSQVLA